MSKKYAALILLYCSFALGSLDNKEKQLIDDLRNEYLACQKHWNQASRYLSRGNKKAFKATVMQAQAQEQNKRNAQRALAKFQAKRDKLT